MAIEKVNARPTFKLRPVRLPGKATPEKGRFRAIVTSRDTYDTERVVQEMLDRSGHHMSVSQVESVVTDLLDTMIKLTLNDGATRRFGDYFEVRLDLRGTFEEQDSRFDPGRHEVKVSLVPLKKFRVKSRTKPPQNEVKVPRAHIEEVRSATAAPNEIKEGEDIIFTGRDLSFAYEDDYLLLSVPDIHLEWIHAPFANARIKEHTDKRIVIPYPEEFTKMGPLHPKAIYREVTVAVYSSGGKAGAKRRRITSGLRPVILGGEADA